MKNSRNTHILASTALALVLAIPFGGMVLDATKLAAVAGTPAAPTPAQSAPAATLPGTDLPLLAMSTAVQATMTQPAAATQPATATEQTSAPQQPAAEPTAPADPLAALDPADRAVAEKIRDLLAAKADRFFAGKSERAAAIAFYQNRNLAPLWLDQGVVNARAEAVIAHMKSADGDGLEPADYKAPNFAGLSPDALAEAELKLTHTVLTYARHLQAGRFPYTRVSRNIELPQTAPEPADILTTLAAAADAGKALDRFTPQQEPYRKLKGALAELRSKGGAAKGQIDTIVANMERWRWYPRDLGNAHVQVNLPDFTLKVMHNGQQAWTTRIVIGKPSMPTPLLSETMKYITVNPTWHVPQSIVQNEYLPALAQDPTVLERMGLRVSYNGSQVEITQPPGEGNALGRLRFNFPNRFSVYHHDTPDKHYFAESFRAFSHGCMRVQDPAKYAEVLLNIARPREHWTAERIKGMFGGAEQDIQLQPTPVWVHLTYQTAFVDSAGKLQTRRDLYNLDSRTLNAIKSERGTVEPASERKREPEVASGTGANKPARPARVTGTTATQSMVYNPGTISTPSYARPLTLPSIYR
jgi:murein L,D-transpeptidase YcbB/YkuD